MIFKYACLEKIEGKIKGFQVYPVEYKESIAWRHKKE